MSPSASDATGGRTAADALAGADGVVTELPTMGIHNLRRRLSKAEVYSLRKALLGLGHVEPLRPLDATADPTDAIVGYVCVGAPAGPQTVCPAGPTAGDAHAADDPIAVLDHANLTWYSPLIGPNDDMLGPRFPVTAGLYDASRVVERVRSRPGIVAGVWDETALSSFETRMIFEGSADGAPEFAAVSAELASVAILAAHLGFRVAALVIGASRT